jgi:hypothetical protein
LEFLENRMTHGDEVRGAVESALEKWGTGHAKKKAAKD